MDRPKPDLHGRDHRKGGADPTPSSLTVTNGTTIEDVETLQILGVGLNVTGTTPTATIQLAGYTLYSPVLTGDTTDPDLGGGGGGTAAYHQFQTFVHYSGFIQFGTSPDPGSGLWGLSMPVGALGGGLYVGTGFLIRDFGPGARVVPLNFFVTNTAGIAEPIRMAYLTPDTSIRSVLTYVDGDTIETDFSTLEASDMLTWSLVYG